MGEHEWERKYVCWKCGKGNSIDTYSLVSGVGMCCGLNEVDRERLYKEEERVSREGKRKVEAFYNLGKESGFEVYRYWDKENVHKEWLERTGR